MRFLLAGITEARMRAGLVLVCLALACSRRIDPPSPAPGCVPGAAQPCACIDGRAGAQTCLDDRTFAPCVCVAPMQAEAPAAEPVAPSLGAVSPRRLPQRPAAERAPETSASTLPETPDRGAVRSALSGLSSAVRACGTGTGGTAMVTIVFESVGRAISATVGGIPAGPEVACIVGVVLRATVPPFTRSTFSVTYPYPIN